MASAMQQYVSRDDQRLIERIILDLADTFDIRVVWEHEKAILAGVFALAGGLIGGYTGGKVAAAVGAGLGTVTGLGVSAMISLKEIWESVKDKLKELIYIVINYLRRFDATDYERAYYILMSCISSRRELVLTICEFIGQKLCRVAISNIQNS